ncbi:MAG: pitrilysin family protein [Endomicrobiia bacterium]
MNTHLIFDPLQDRKLKLDNGLTVLLKRYSTLPLVSIQVWVKVGSIYESEEINGISHFLEHMVFKETSKYTSTVISKKIEYYGGIINAGTSKEYTVYYIDIPKEGIKDAIDVLSQLVFYATFPDEEIQKEKNVIIEEIKRLEDQPMNVLYENFNALLFTKTPYKWRIIGRKENIQSFTKNQVKEFYQNFYHPQNMVLSICGDINYEEIEKLIRESFGKINGFSYTKSIKSDLKEDPKSDIIEIKKHKVQHLYFLCGFLGPNINEFEQYAGDITSVILGEGVSSRLYKILREEKKLVYEIHSGFYTQMGPSVFYILGICEPQNFEEAIRAIKNVISNLKTEGPTEEELIKAKNILLTRWYLNNENVHSIASTLAWWEMFLSLDAANSYIENINNVSKEDVKNFLEKYGGYLVTTGLQP